MSSAQISSAAKEINEKSRGFIKRHFPRTWPFLRLARWHEPVNTLIGYWPVTWGFLLAANTSSVNLEQTAFHFALFFLLMVFYAGATSVVNDMWDKDIDSKVERCKTRPIASGEVTMKQAAILFSALVVVCVLLILNVNTFCRNIYLFNLIPAALYPATKRFFPYPSVFLGLFGNWTTLVGWSAVTESLDLSVCGPLLFGGVCWAVTYDTIYGSQDKKDDVQAGIHSMALTFGSYTRTVIILAALGTMSGLSLAGVLVELRWPFYVGMLIASLHMGYQIFTVDLDNPSDCQNKFDANATFGGLVCLAMLAGNWRLLQRSWTAPPDWHEL